MVIMKCCYSASVLQSLTRVLLKAFNDRMASIHEKSPVASEFIVIHTGDEKNQTAL